MAIPISKWSEAWRRAYSEAQERIPAVYRDEEKAKKDAAAAVARVRSSRQALDRFHAQILAAPEAARGGALAAYAMLDRAWNETASALYQDAVDTRTGKPVQIGWIPILIGVIALAAAAVAFAPAITKRADAVQTQAETQSRELDARVAASREGRVLPPSTVPPPDGGLPGEGGGKGLWIALGALAVVGLVGGGGYLALRARG